MLFIIPNTTTYRFPVYCVISTYNKGYVLYYWLPLLPMRFSTLVFFLSFIYDSALGFGFGFSFEFSFGFGFGFGFHFLFISTSGSGFGSPRIKNNLPVDFYTSSLQYQRSMEAYLHLSFT